MSKAWEPEFSHQDYHILKEEKVYEGYCSIMQYSLEHKLFKGGMSHPLQRELFCRSSAVAVLLYDPEQDRVILIEQIRIGALADPLGPWLLEVVAGLIDAGETPEICARREAMEEAACIIETLIPICHYWVSPGISNEKTMVYCGITKAGQTGQVYGLQHDGEDIKVHIIPAREAFALLKDGKITSASAVIALQWLELNHASFLRELQ